jgi:hypothetical protein
VRSAFSTVTARTCSGATGKADRRIRLSNDGEAHIASRGETSADDVQNVGRLTKVFGDFLSG